MELNTKDKILTLKVVYYGPALGGKTTNLLTIHALTDKEQRTELISIATRDDRTLFFDLLPMGLGRFFGYDLKLKLYTVPGQVQFDVTRRRVLAGADAIVFVADSQRAQAANNALSLKNLRINMNQNRLDPKTTSTVLQFNKRDLPDVMTVEEMARALNDELKVPGFPAVSTTGQGVIECLATAVGRAFDGIVAGHRLAPPAEAKRAGVAVRETIGAFAIKGDPLAGSGQSASGAALGVGATGQASAAVRPAGASGQGTGALGSPAVPGGARSARQPAAPGQGIGSGVTARPGGGTFAGAAGVSPNARPGAAPTAQGESARAGGSSPGSSGASSARRPDSVLVGPSGPDASGTWMHHADAKVTDEVDLLDEAVKANIALSERIADYRAAGARAARREHQVKTLGALARFAEDSGDPARIESELLALALETMRLSRGSLLAKPATGAVTVRAMKGHAEDPFTTVPSPPLGSVAERMIAAGKVHVTNDVSSDIFFGEFHPSASGIFCLLFAPVRLGEGIFGGLFLYGSDPADPFDQTDSHFVEAACRIVSLARIRAAAGAAH